MQDQSGSDSQDNFQLNKLNPSRPKPQEVVLKAESKLSRVSLGRAQAPRLIIDFIELDNFKSYANKQTIGPFHHSFSSVVGPNGSGKSNLIESLLFIFGYTASWMRLSKLAQLIHHSSAFNDVQRAVVSVHFREVIDNEDGSVSNLPRSQFSLKRSVNTQGISKYYINDRESTQTEVKDLLMKKGIDLSHNRFLILQGEVEQIASMKQKSGNKDHPGLLQYLEDIIGSSQFVEPLEELTKKFNELEEKRHERGERMKLSETELKGMTKGKDQAVRYVKREKRMYQLDNAYIQVMRKKAENAFSIHEGRLKQAQVNKIKVIDEAKVRLAAQTDRQKEIRQIKQQINENTKAQSKLAAEFDKLTQKDKFLRDQCKYKTEDQFKYKKKSEELNKEYTKIIQESKQASEQLPKRIEQLRSLVDEIKKLQEELDKYGPQENPKELNNMQSQLKEMDMSIASLQEKRDHYQQKLNKLQQMENAGSNQTSDRQVQAQEVKGKLKEYDVGLKRANQMLQQQLETQRGIQERYEKLRNDIEAIDAMFRERQADKQEQGERGTMHQQIMKQKFPGVLGRLCDLGSVEKEYDEIISSSCFQLESMVVQTYEAGQAIVEFLKKTKLGKVTCVILDKIPEFATYMIKHFQAPGGSVRLFDLIKPDNEKAKVAFYYALRDTLYCKDSNLANKIAYDPSNRRRVVTYAQNRTIRVIEMNGTMSSNRIRQGLLANKGKGKKGEFDDKDVMKLEADRQKLQYTMKSLQEEKKNNDGKILEVEGDIAQMERLKKTLELTLQNINDELKYTMNRDPVKVAREKQHIQKELGILTAQITKQDEQRDKLNNTVKRLEEDFKRRQSPEVIKLKDRIKDMNQERKDLEAKVNKFKAKTDSTADRLKKVEHDSQDALKKADEMQKSIEKINVQISGIETEGEKMMVLRVSCEQKIKALKTKEHELAKLNKDDEGLVNQSRAKVEAAKADVDRQKAECRKKREESDNYAIQLDQRRGDYRKIVASYDFLRDLDEIENMFADERRNTSIEDLSLLDHSALNVSGFADNPKIRAFPVDIVYKSEPIADYSEAEIEQIMIFEERLKAQAELEKQRLERVEGSGLAIINEFRDKYRQYTERLAIFEEVKNELISVKKMMDDLKEKRLTMFREGFQVISSKLKQVYQLLTKGGDAELDLIDSLDPFSQGVNFSVRPPKKTWKEINKLSGGEKTLSSLSLVFALHYYKPTPLYFMDQIDAALDYKNVSVVANYIKKRTKNAQFIIISLRNNMFELADKLIGVYKTHDQTKTISIIPELVMKKIRENEQKENQGVN